MTTEQQDDRAVKLDRAKRVIEILDKYPDMPLPEFIPLHESMQLGVVKPKQTRGPRVAKGASPLAEKTVERKGK